MHSKRIYISETQLKNLTKQLMESERKYPVDPDKVSVVKKYLDKNFIKGGISCLGEDGYPTTTPIVALKGTDGKPMKNMTAKQLFYMLQDKFKNIYLDKGQRDKFLKVVIQNWYPDKISKEGLLNTNSY